MPAYPPRRIGSWRERWTPTPRRAPQRRIALPDGLYQVTTARFCAGFCVEQGHVVLHAPILRKYLTYLERITPRGQSPAGLVRVDRVEGGDAG